MNYAIVTRFIGPTDTKGPRVSATARPGRCRVIVGWDHRKEELNNHEAAMRALVKKMDWDDGEYVSGQLPDGSWAHCYRE